MPDRATELDELGGTPVREVRARHGAFDWPELETSFTERLAAEDFTGATVLDLGTGSGRLALLLAPRAKRVVGIDTDEAALDAARDRAREMGASNVTFLTADADTADYRLVVGGGSDYVVASHFMSDAAVRSAASALRPGGKLVFVCHHRDNWIESGRVGRFSFDERQMKALLRETGFLVQFLGIDRTVVTYDDLRALAEAHPYLREKFERDSRWSALRERFGDGPARLTWAALVGVAVRG
jgi:SAM-dependent methyltransferase